MAYYRVTNGYYQYVTTNNSTSSMGYATINYYGNYSGNYGYKAPQKYTNKSVKHLLSKDRGW